METIRAATRYGDMIVAAADNYVGRSIVEYGEWSQSEIDLLQQIIKPGMIVLDIGANIGYHTLAFSKATGPTGKVVSFEPQPEIFQLLCANIAINNLSNVTALNIALGKARGIVDMPSINYNVPGNFGALRLDHSLKEEQSVVSRTPISLNRLDDIFHAQNAMVIKMDVECMELDVLKGATALLEKSRPAMLVENNLPGEMSEHLLKFLFDLNYNCYWQFSFSYSNNNYNQNSNNIFGSGGSPNVIAIPSEVPITVNGFSKIIDISDHPLKRAA